LACAKKNRIGTLPELEVFFLYEQNENNKKKNLTTKDCVELIAFNLFVEWQKKFYEHKKLQNKKNLLSVQSLHFQMLMQSYQLGVSSNGTL
jgi:hypothetical protein